MRLTLTRLEAADRVPAQVRALGEFLDAPAKKRPRGAALFPRHKTQDTTRGFALLGAQKRALNGFSCTILVLDTQKSCSLVVPHKEEP